MKIIEIREGHVSLQEYLKHVSITEKKLCKFTFWKLNLLRNTENVGNPELYDPINTCSPTSRRLSGDTL